jgi:orotate phosphoribosyltransferase
MNHLELAKNIYDIAHLTGEFKLRSGQISNEYFDKYRFESQPHLLNEIAEQMKLLIPKDIEALAALEMGGIPIATALSLKTGLPCVFVRKSAKDYGTCKFAEGIEIKNKKLCIIEDVVTTGGQVFLSATDLKSTGATVEHVLCVIDRGENSKAKMLDKGLKLQSLFTRADFNF